MGDSLPPRTPTPTPSPTPTPTRNPTAIPTRSPGTIPAAARPAASERPVSPPPIEEVPLTPTPGRDEPPRRRRSGLLVATGAFVLGGVVGAGGFGLGQRYGQTETTTTQPVVNAAAPSTSEATAVPIPNAQPAPAPVPIDPSAEPAAAVARILGPSVVQVETERGQGSGVVYANDLLLTNHHVIEGADNVRIRTADGEVFDVEVLGSDPRNDIAVLATEPGSDLPVAAIGSSASLEVGQLTVAIGSPFQLQQTVTAGIVSSVNRPVPNATGSLSAMIQTDAPINPGNSGGALGNRNGELVGINASIRTDGTSNSNVGIGFAVPIDTAIEVAARIVDGQPLDPGVLGVSGEPSDDAAGVPIAEVVDGSGADAAGLQVGDRVLTIDGAPVTSIGELVGLVQSNFSGDAVQLEIQRGDETLLVTATLS